MHIFYIYKKLRPKRKNLHEQNVGNYLEKFPVRIWKKYIPLLIVLLISNNFSSMTFFCATRILRVIGRQSIVYNTCKRSLCSP